MLVSTNTVMKLNGFRTSRMPKYSMSYPVHTYRRTEKWDRKFSSSRSSKSQKVNLITRLYRMVCSLLLCWSSTFFLNWSFTSSFCLVVVVILMNVSYAFERHILVRFRFFPPFFFCVRLSRLKSWNVRYCYWTASKQRYGVQGIVNRTSLRPTPYSLHSAVEG